jgi:hypothetical protein
MKTIKIFCLLICFLLISYSNVRAEKISEVIFNNYVFDNANILDASESDSLNSILKHIDDETTNQIVIAIINSLGGQMIEDFSLELFNRTGIGQKIKHNGVLILLSIQDRKVRIALGYGLENIITDSYAGIIIREEMIPHFKQEDYYKGLLNSVMTIKNELYKPDIKEYFSMKWDIKNFEEFITKYPESTQRCDALMFLGRFYEDKWNESIIKILNENYRKKSIYYYKKYLSSCDKGIWKVKVKYELKQIENKKPDSIRYLVD